MKISEDARKTVSLWAAAQHRPLALELITADGHPRQDELASFCAWLAGQCPQLVLTETAADHGEPPALRLRGGAASWRAVPAGTELGPFLEALSREEASAPADLRPTSLRLFVASACPHCPGAVRALLPLIAPGGPVTLEVIDSEACPEAAEAGNVKSVPTLVLDDRFRWTGSIRAADLEALLGSTGGSDLDAGTMERLLENGNAGPLAGLMADAGRINPALGRLLAAEAMSTRLGAMMVVEELLEREPALVERFVPELRKHFDTAPEPARGDMLYIFGEAGPSSMKSEITGLLAAGLHPEVAEAAREALERLNERHE